MKATQDKKRTTPSPTRRLGSVDDAAAELDVSSKTIRRRIADGTIAAYRAGRLIKVDLDQAAGALLRPMNEAARVAATTTMMLGLLAASLAPPPTRARVAPQPKAGEGTGGEVRLAPWAAIAEVHAAARSMPNKRAACDLLASRFPGKSRGWFVRNLSRLMAMSPLDFAGEIGDHRHHGEPLPKGQRPVPARAEVSLGE